MSHEKHPCAVCPKQIGRGHLMCARHWHLVPHELQTAVFRTYRAMTRATGPGALETIKAYRAARDAAVSSVADPSTESEGETP